MYVAGAFDPSSATSGFVNIGTIDPDQKALFYNLSSIMLLLTFPDGTTGLLHPGEANWWTLSIPTPSILWRQYDALSGNSPPMSTCTVQVFGFDEDIPGVYPMSLVYMMNLGNTITISQGSVSTLQNDGNSTTNIIESTLLGSTGSNVLVKNDGTMTLAQYITGVLTDLLQVIPGGTSVLKLGNTGLVSEVLGSLKVDQNETVTGTLGVTGNTTLSTVSTSGAATLNSASITNNETVGGTLGVTGNTSLSTVSTSGLATLNSASVTNNETVGGTLGVTGNTSLSTVSTSGLATLNSASVTNNETVGGTLGVTGNSSFSTLSTSGAATLNSASVTNNETVGGTLGVTGNTSLSTLSTSGLSTLNSSSITNNETVHGNLSVIGTTSLDNGNITTDGSGHIVIPNNVAYEAKDTGGTARPILYIDNTNTLQIESTPTNNTIQFDDHTGLTMHQMDATGISIHSGNLQFLTGSIKRVVKFTGTIAVGKVSVNPNMTDTPDLVLVNFNVTGTPSPHTIAPNYATLSATNIDIWSDIGSVPFVGVAIKF